MVVTPARSAQVLVGVVGAALALTACSSTSSTSPATPAPPQSTAGGTATAPPPPAGAEQLDTQTNGTVEYSRYSISGTTPATVISDYESSAKAAGYTVTSTGGGGGGWGGYGGSEAGMTGSMTGAYLDVQAGGQKSGPTYFEVCVGPDQSAVDQCDQNSQKASDSQSSGS